MYTCVLRLEPCSRKKSCYRADVWNTNGHECNDAESTKWSANAGQQRIVAESNAATEHLAAGAETIMSMQAIFSELSASWTDDARDLVHAAEVILINIQKDVRNLCKPWGAQLQAQNRYRRTEAIRHELKMALTQRAMKLKSETKASGAATEHAEAEVAAECTATEHASEEFCLEAAMAEIVLSMQAIVTEFSASSTDNARDLVNAAQAILKNR